MSKIDLLIRELLDTSYSEATTDIKESHKTKLIRDFRAKQTRFESKANNVTIENFCELILNPHEVEFELAKNRLSKFFPQEAIMKNGFIEKMQLLRNRFAHKKSSFSAESGTISLVGEDESFDFDKFAVIRKDLMLLRESLEGLLFSLKAIIAHRAKNVKLA